MCVPTGTVPCPLSGSVRYRTLSWMENNVLGPIPMTPFCSPVTGMERASLSYLNNSIFRLPKKKKKKKKKKNDVHVWHWTVTEELRRSLLDFEVREWWACYPWLNYSNDGNKINWYKWWGHTLLSSLHLPPPTPPFPSQGKFGTDIARQSHNNI